jgi:hypothetical protein
MRLRPDVVVFVVILGLAAAAVVWQTNSPDVAPRSALALIDPTPLGSVVPDFELTDVGGEKRRLSDRDWHGSVATVVYFFSVSCPCVDAIEPRMKRLFARFPRDAKNPRFEYVAIDADPDDQADDVIAKMARLGSFYRMLLDPTQETAAVLGGTSAGLVVVLDGERRVRYRGSIDDDFEKPTRFHLMEVLEALEAGREPPGPLETPGYGCPYPGIEGVCSTEAAAAS